MSIGPEQSNGQDNELLSALFDGELAGDRARFALKRLGHDAEWRATCERWQRAGDALRGRGAALTAYGLADRVAAAVAAEPVPKAMSPRRSTRDRPWRFGGLAIAASLAAAAVLLMPQLPQSGVPEASPSVAAAPAAASVIVDPMPDAALAVGVSPLALDRVAATSGPPPRNTPVSSDRVRARRVAGEVVAAAAAETAEIVPGSLASAVSLDPVAASNVSVRPWPPAVLPRSDSLFQVSYASAPPAFDPFQSRAPGDADAIAEVAPTQD